MRLGLYKRTPVFVSAGKKRIIKRRITIFLFLMLVSVFAYLFFERVYPNYISRVDIYASSLATSVINSTLSDVLGEGYDDEFVDVKTNSGGTVTSVEADAVSMNSFKAELTQRLQDNMNNLPDGYVTIPLGSLLNKEIFSGLGPKMKIKTVPNGIVKVDFSEEFVSCGINQVKHKIFLDVSVTVSVISATMQRTREVKTSIPLSETVVSGVVPNYYGGYMGFASPLGEDRTE